MKLSEINFYNGGRENAWEDFLKTPLFVLPMHAEKWFLIKKRGGWDKILKEADVFVADGVGLSLGYKLVSGKNVQKISGVDLIEDVVNNHPKTPTYIWGTTEENIQKAAKAYKKRGLNLVGFHNGFTGQDEEVLEEIKKSGAKVAFIGMVPKRAAELCVRINKELKITSMTAGGSFDVAGGEFKRAPLITQKLGLEWLWRMMLDPKRFKRLPSLIGFVWYVLLEKIGISGEKS